MKNTIIINKGKHETTVEIRENTKCYETIIQLDDGSVWDSFVTEKIAKSINFARMTRKTYLLSVKGEKISERILTELKKLGFKESTPSESTPSQVHMVL